jgi:hypothetical protein
MPIRIIVAEAPKWVLAIVHESKPEDWEPYRQGWLNRSRAFQDCPVNAGLAGVYVSCYGALELLKEIHHDETL